MGKAEKARELWQQATESSDPGTGRAGARRRSNSNLSPERYYEALAERKLGRNDDAEAALKSLLQAAEERLGRREIPAARRGDGSGARDRASAITWRALRSRGWARKTRPRQA